MNFSRLTAFSALLLWGLALWGERFHQPSSWVLVDSSASCRLATQQAASLLQSEPGPSLWQSSSRAGQVLYSDQGVADLLRLADPQPGDTVAILTDGRTLHELPSAAKWRGVDLRIPEIPATPHILRIHGPRQLPHGNQSFALDLSIQDADFSSGQVAILANQAIQVEPIQLIPHSSVVRVVVSPDLSKAWRREPLNLKITWSDSRGVDSQTWSLGSTHSDGVVFPTAMAHQVEGRNFLLERMRQFGFVFLASSQASDWFHLIPEWQLFRLPEQQNPPTLVLLDTSGSMAGGALDQARDILCRWAGLGRNLRVLPFAHELKPVLALTSEADREKLLRMQAFGSTQPILAIQAVQGDLSQGVPTILLSDGRPEGRQPNSISFSRSDALQVIPVGSDPDLDFLASLGTIVESDGAWSDQFEAVLENSLKTTSALWLPTPNTLTALPGSVLPTEAIPFLSSSPGTESLMETAQGAVALVARPLTEGLLIGHLGEPSATFPRFQSTIDSYDFGSSAPDIPLVLSSEPMMGPLWLSSSKVTEFTAPRDAWQEWLLNQKEKGYPKPYSSFLWAGLILALTSIFLRNRNKHG